MLDKAPYPVKVDYFLCYNLLFTSLNQQILALYVLRVIYVLLVKYHVVVL